MRRLAVAQDCSGKQPANAGMKTSEMNFYNNNILGQTTTPSESKKKDKHKNKNKNIKDTMYKIRDSRKEVTGSR